MAFNLNFQTFFFRQLPTYFKKNDSYKDANNKGLLERFLETIGREIDDHIIIPAETYMNIRDTITIPDNLLSTLAKDLGSPPNVLIDPALLRKVLTYIVTLYKIKGIKESYELLFSLLGYAVNIVEYPELDVRMDSDYEMDSGYYMDSVCVTCSDYEIILFPLDAECNPTEILELDEELLYVITLIVNFTEPINANLLGYVGGVDACDDIDGCIDQEILINIIKYTHMDEEAILLMDDGHTMDTGTIINGQAIKLDCGTNEYAILATETPDEALTQEQDDNSPILV